MKAYLITTGAIFGILAALHVWRLEAEWQRAAGGFVFGMTAITLLCAILALWAFRLLRTIPR